MLGIQFGNIFINFMNICITIIRKMRLLYLYYRHFYNWHPKLSTVGKIFMNIRLSTIS